MPTILIAEDDAEYRELAGDLLRAALPDVKLVFARDGQEALDALGLEVPDVLLTDLNMPKVDGLSLVARMRAEHAAVPVVLMTSHGSEELAVQALKRGAASYVAKKNLRRDLPEILAGVLEIASADRKERQLLECIVEHETRFRLTNDPALMAPLISYLQHQLARRQLVDETRRMRIGIALHEAMSNAIFHGNLEVSSELRKGDGQAYHQLAAERRRQPPYCDRHVHVIARETGAEAIYMIRDEGPGFDVTSVRDPLAPDRVETPSGRGLLLIHTFMDRVSFNAKGNQIIMAVRAASPHAAAQALK